MIDGDILLYAITKGNEREERFSEDYHILFSCFDECRPQLNARIDEILAGTGCKDFRIYLSGSGNWRKRVLPTYKEGRKVTRKPLAFERLKHYMEDEYFAEKIDGLEADDLLGIHSAPGNVIVSLDKDFFGVAGNFTRMDLKGNFNSHIITEDQARYYHFLQAFMGDRTDGYAGCPGIGAIQAAKKITKVTGSVDSVTKFQSLAVWRMIVSEYERAGQTVDDATENFMVSKILDGKTGAFDPATQEVHILLPTGVVHAV